MSIEPTNGADMAHTAGHEPGTSPTERADARIPAAHPFVGHLQRVAAADAAESHRPWQPADGPLPSLYLSHGAPPLLEDVSWMAQLRAWARSMPRPRAILAVSAHWERAPAAITSSAAGTPLVYDFGGFHPLYYDMAYATPDASALAGQIRAVLPRSMELHQDQRGLDHGAWVPLKAMFPAADIPVLQLSLPTHDPAELLALGQRLRPLRAEGVLVIGSGFMTHGLPFVDFNRPDRIPSWSAEFDQWAARALATGDLDELVGYASRAPGLPFAHPTAEHFSPLFVTLGAASDLGAPVDTIIDGYMYGLSRRSVQAA